MKPPIFITQDGTRLIRHPVTGKMIFLLTMDDVRRLPPAANDNWTAAQMLEVKP